MNININHGIAIDIVYIPRKNKTINTKYTLDLGFNIYQNGIKRSSYSFSIGITVNISDWGKNEVTGKSIHAKLINERLNEYLSVAVQLIRELSSKNVKTCNEIEKELKHSAKQRITGKATRGKKEEFISKLKEHSYENIMKNLFEHKQISEGRQRGYNRSFELLQEYFKKDVPNIDMIADTDLTDFKIWFLKNHTVKQNTATDYFSKIAAVFKQALRLKIITVNPLPEKFRGYFVDGNRDVLNENECLDIINLDDRKLSKTEIIAKYCLVLQLTTGMGYGDMKALKEVNLKYDEAESQFYIEKNRNKTNVAFKVFLSSNAKFSLDKLIELTKDENNPINIPSIDYSLRIYKVLGMKANIKTNITTYTLRHTFAVNHMENDGRLEDLQKYLGHTELKTTGIYGKISNKRLSTKIKELEGKSKMHQLQPRNNLKAV